MRSEAAGDWASGREVSLRGDKEKLRVVYHSSRLTLPVSAGALAGTEAGVLGADDGDGVSAAGVPEDGVVVSSVFGVPQVSPEGVTGSELGVPQVSPEGAAGSLTDSDFFDLRDTGAGSGSASGV